MSWFTKRPGAVYGIKVHDHEDRSKTIRRGYIGKTRQKVASRILQHVETQPFSDLIVDHETLWESRRCTGLRLWWEEVWRIVMYRPIYNYEWNRIFNGRRIPKYRAVSQRELRDQERRYRSTRVAYMDRFDRRQQGNGLFGQPETDKRSFQINGARRPR